MKSCYFVFKLTLATIRWIRCCDIIVFLAWTKKNWNFSMGRAWLFMNKIASELALGLSLRGYYILMRKNFDPLWRSKPSYATTFHKWPTRVAAYRRFNSIYFLYLGVTLDLVELLILKRTIALEEMPATLIGISLELITFTRVRLAWYLFDECIPCWSVSVQK